LGLGHGHAPRKSVVLGLEFFETSFGLGDLGAEFLLGLLGGSAGKPPGARSEGDGCIVGAQLAASSAVRTVRSRRLSFILFYPNGVSGARK